MLRGQTTSSFDALTDGVTYSCYHYNIHCYHYYVIIQCIQSNTHSNNARLSLLLCGAGAVSGGMRNAFAMVAMVYAQELVTAMGWRNTS